MSLAGQPDAREQTPTPASSAETALQAPLLLRALRREPVERPPVWLMRQAGRYLTEYQALKEKYSFLELCRSSELALEISLQPVRFLDPDAAIVFADILLPLQAMGLELSFDPGPRIPNPIKNRSDVEALQTIDPHVHLSFVLDAIAGLKTEFAKADARSGSKAVIGFAGAPWTLACYAVAQSQFKNFHGTQVFAYQDPSTLHLLLDRLSDAVADFLAAQIESGADVVQLFDTWAGNLSCSDYRRFALPYTQRIVDRVHRFGRPIVLYVNGSSHLLRPMLDSGAQCLSVDWRTDLAVAAETLNNQAALQGNLDPAHLFGSVAEVQSRTRTMIGKVKQHSGYVANLGHGVLPTTPRENALAFVQAVKAGWTTG